MSETEIDSKWKSKIHHCSHLKARQDIHVYWLKEIRAKSDVLNSCAKKDVLSIKKKNLINVLLMVKAQLEYFFPRNLTGVSKELGEENFVK